MRIRPLRDWLLLGEASVDLTKAAAKLHLRHFRKLVAPASPSVCKRQIGEDELARLIWAVQASSRRVPFRAKCFERALGLRSMLHRRGVQAILHYGIRKSRDEGLEAHVWLSVEGRVVLGGQESSRFAAVATFSTAAEG